MFTVIRQILDSVTMQFGARKFVNFMQLYRSLAAAGVYIVPPSVGKLCENLTQSREGFYLGALRLCVRLSKTRGN
jgi:hypothetical protein